MNIIIATTKSWNIEAAKTFRNNHQEHNIHIIEEKDDLAELNIRKFNPRYIFFPHWSWIIPESIFEKYECVVFHMTDLPFGRGGSPLQNLIVRGIYDTKISAIKVSSGLDAGPIYFKEVINIEFGSADEILSRVSKIVFEKMIPRFLVEDIVPIEQVGNVEEFKRRTRELSEIPGGLTPKQIYDYIRMLDGEGYPRAFRRYDGGKVYFTNAHYENDVVTADAEFVSEL